MAQFASPDATRVSVPGHVKTNHANGTDPFLVVFNPKSDRHITTSFDDSAEGLEAASRVAESSARLNPDETFFIMKSVAIVRVPPNEVMCVAYGEKPKTLAELAAENEELKARLKDLEK